MIVYNTVKSILRDNDIDVYLPGQYPNDGASGVCRSPYVVIQNGGTYSLGLGYVSGYTLLRVHAYVPINQYPILSELIAKIKKLLAPLDDMIYPTGNEFIHVIDDNRKAHTTYIEYQILRRI